MVETEDTDFRAYHYITTLQELESVYPVLGYQSMASSQAYLRKIHHFLAEQHSDPLHLPSSQYLFIRKGTKAIFYSFLHSSQMEWCFIHSRHLVFEICSHF